MSKAFAAIIVTLGLMAPVASFAAVASCGNGTLGTVVCGNGSPELVQSPWGKNSDVPHIQPGQSVRDDFGNTFLCPFWFTNYCVDLTHTAYYLAHR